MKKREIKFKNLSAEMGRANISVTELAEKMQITKQALYKKLDGSSQFVYKDLRAIQNILQQLNSNSYTLDYLFADNGN